MLIVSRYVRITLKLIEISERVDTTIRWNLDDENLKHLNGGRGGEKRGGGLLRS